MTVRTTISLPDDLVEEIDQIAGPRGRSGFLAQAARNEVKRQRLRRALDRARGIMVGRPGWQSGDEILQRVSRLRSDDRDLPAPRGVPDRG